MRKKLIARNIDIKHLNELEDAPCERQQGNPLVECVNDGWMPCCSIPVFKDGEIIAYKFIFVKDSGDEDECR